MKVHLYERIWMIAAAAVIAIFLGTIAVGTLAQGSQPPSHVETIDPKAVWTDPRFANRGVEALPDGAVRVTGIAMMFAFQPGEIRVPAGKKVTFRLTSADVVHGFQIVGTNANAMVVPGYVTQFSTVFDRPGEYLIVCNEYCGLGHHMMMGRLVVEARQ
ncbi:MAG: cytochrome c oxidase subunit II [Gemmatimonadales bacterium]|nr:MAG: cytochrome c oxidase subunit II [Gemmatimonadales bacterium]